MRLIRPLLVVRVSVLLLGSRCVYRSRQKLLRRATRKKSTATTASTARRAAPRVARTPAYSASASHARKARLARARAAARGREASRIRAAPLQEAMTPRYKTDANGELVPDVRAAAAIIFNPATGEVLCQRELAGQALDCQHHQGDDDGGLPRRQPGPQRKSPSSAATSTPPRRPTSSANDHLPGRVLHLAADCVRQRRGPHRWRACRTAAPRPSSSG